jgi:hypothetical protein
MNETIVHGPEGYGPPLTFERLCTLILFLGIAVAAGFTPAQNDTWWQLRTGQEIWRARAIDLHDRFSYTVFGAYWPNHEWLSQVLGYAMYHAGGMRLLTACAAALICAGWALIWRLTPGSTPRRLLLCGIGVMSSATAWALRPQVATLFLVAATAALLARRRYLLLPLIFFVWANLHGGVTLGLVLLAAEAITIAFEQQRLPVRFLAIAAGCVAAATITPLGTSLWTDVPASLARLRAYGVTEWRAPGIGDPGYTSFWLLAAALVVLAMRWRPWRSTIPGRATPVWAALGMLPLAIGTGRNVAPFVLLAVPAIAALWESQVPSRRQIQPRAARTVLNAGILAVLAALSVAIVAYAWTTELPRLGWHPLPAEAASALASCPERLYNRYDEGGYVIWFVPGRKVFLDSRQDPYPPALVREQIDAERSGDYRALFARYAIGCASVAADSPMARHLAADGWSAVYQGSGWAIMTPASAAR